MLGQIRESQNNLLVEQRHHKDRKPWHAGPFVKLVLTKQYDQKNWELVKVERAQGNQLEQQQYLQDRRFVRASPSAESKFVA